MTTRREANGTPAPIVRVRANRKIDREAEILRLREEDGLTHTAIAEKVGCSRQLVSRTLLRKAPLSGDEVARIRSAQILDLTDARQTALERYLAGSEEAGRNFARFDERLSRVAGTDSATKFALERGEEGEVHSLREVLGSAVIVADPYAPLGIEAGETGE